MFDKVVFHVDVNSAFLSWEADYRISHLGGKLDLREIPSAVGGDITQRHGIILAKSQPAKRYHIKTGESIPEAKQKCPHLLIVPPNYGLYQKCSQAMMKLLKEFTPDVEQYSIDEAFMDMTGTSHLFGTPKEAAELLKERIYRELNFTVNVGISSNKLLAKMASDFKKPNQVHTLFPEEIEEKMWELPVSELFFVGRATAKKLYGFGIRTIGELAQADLQMLKLHLKKQGELIWNFANGKDVSVVESVPPPHKGYGNSATIPFDVTDAQTAKMILLGLAETVGTRLRRHQVKAGVIAVGIKDFEFHYTSHQMILDNPTNITSEIHRMACYLFDELWNKVPIRHLGIHLGRISDAQTNRQMTLFDLTDYEKLEKLDHAIDTIRERHGSDSIKRAVFLSGAIDHMPGGISREKRSVDYSRIDINKLPDGSKTGG